MTLKNKNSKHCFYLFSDYSKEYEGKRTKIKHTQKLKDSVGLKKVEVRNKQFLIEKMIHSAEFKNPYEDPTEKKSEIIDVIETNYRVARRVYQDVYLNIADYFQDFNRSPSPQQIQDIDDDIKSNSWGVKNVLAINNYLELLNIFQTFYYTIGRLPLTNGLLVVPDGDAPPGEN